MKTVQQRVNYVLLGVLLALIATRLAMPYAIEGRISRLDTETWEAFTAILENAFVKAFKGDVEESIELERLNVDKPAR